MLFTIQCYSDGILLRMGFPFAKLKIEFLHFSTFIYIKNGTSPPNYKDLQPYKLTTYLITSY